MEFHNELINPLPDEYFHQLSAKSMYDIWATLTSLSEYLLNEYETSYDPSYRAEALELYNQSCRLSELWRDRYFRRINLI